MRTRKIMRHGLVWLLAAAFLLGMLSHMAASAVLVGDDPADSSERRRLQYKNAAPDSDVPVPMNGYGRYDDLELTEEDRELLARIVYLEARGECFEGQVAVCEVVLNRLLSDAFPDRVAEVLYQPGQFSPADRLSTTIPGEEQYRAVAEAIDSSETVLAENVVYFAQSPQNARVYAVIGCHWFCEV